MNLLLDTHSLIWFLNGEEKLSEKVRIAIENPDNLTFVSIASVWEIAIKMSLGKFQFNKGFEYFLSLIEENGFEILPITFEHAIAVSTLDFIHRDPFDRLLIAQSNTESMPLATKDENIKRYSVQTFW